MPSTLGERAIKEAVVQILDAQRKVRGCGLLVDPWRVLTCAHVIALADSAVHEEQEPIPSVMVHVACPFSAGADQRSGKAIVWRPVKKDSRHERLEDIAVLELDRPAPDGKAPHGLMTSTDWAGRGYMVCGFPKVNSRGDWADGKFKGEQDGGWVQMLASDGSELQVGQGFSGSPVWDTGLRAFAGIIVAVQGRGDDAKPVAFMIPAAVLKEAWKDLAVVSHVDGSLGEARSQATYKRWRISLTALPVRPLILCLLLLCVLVAVISTSFYQRQSQRSGATRTGGAVPSSDDDRGPSELASQATPPEIVASKDGTTANDRVIMAYYTGVKDIAAGWMQDEKGNRILIRRNPTKGEDFPAWVTVESRRESGPVKIIVVARKCLHPSLTPDELGPPTQIGSIESVRLKHGTNEVRVPCTGMESGIYYLDVDVYLKGEPALATRTSNSMLIIGDGG